jgi:hypothetical protein
MHPLRRSPRIVGFAIAIAAVGCGLDWTVPPEGRRLRGGRAAQGGAGVDAAGGSGTEATGAGGDAPVTTTSTTTTGTTGQRDCDQGTCEECESCATAVGGPCLSLETACTGWCRAIADCEANPSDDCPASQTCAECYPDGVASFCDLLTCVVFDTCASTCGQRADPEYWPYCYY